MWQLLRATSRSFYLSLRVLPWPVREPIALAYLAARTTDTIADVAALSVTTRLDALETMMQQLQKGPQAGPIPTPGLGCPGLSRAEQQLLENWPHTLQALRQLDPSDQADVRQVLRQIIHGQQLDLLRFGCGIQTMRAVRALRTAAELNHYTYCVAGSVGEFWSCVCRRHLFPKAVLDEVTWMQDAVRFGQGLQLVNILRDLASDLRQGRCYLPEDELQACGLHVDQLLDPTAWGRFQPCFEKWRIQAIQHLQRGWQYTLALPRRQVRLNLACAWPLLIGGRTLQRLKKVNPLDPTQRVKISRREVRSWLVRTVLLYPWRSVWGGLWNQACPNPRQPAELDQNRGADGSTFHSLCKS
ncbi:MAG: squalene/phytoene synthase family protein [Limisphaera sp.]|nr:squalene/phytoene synthase family protein [Limisphaera sp.]